MSERTEILDPLIKKFPLGMPFRRYAAIREVKFGSGAGRLDLTVVTDEPSILLFEAKLSGNKDSKDKVLGQLVFYLAHALECPPDMVVDEVFRAATRRAANQKAGFWNGQPRRRNEPSRPEVESWIRASVERHKSRPHIRGYIALDKWSISHGDKRLLVPLRMLMRHDLPVSLVLRSGRIVFPNGQISKDAG